MSRHQSILDRAAMQSDMWSVQYSCIAETEAHDKCQWLSEQRLHCRCSKGMTDYLYSFNSICSIGKESAHTELSGWIC